MHPAMEREMNKETRTEARSSRCVQLTVVAGSSFVAGVCTVAVKGAPRLGTFTTVFTIVGQTPTKSCRYNHYFSFWAIIKYWSLIHGQVRGECQQLTERVNLTWLMVIQSVVKWFNHRTKPSIDKFIRFQPIPR